jgi:hypothetical protein
MRCVQHQRVKFRQKGRLDFQSTNGPSFGKRRDWTLIQSMRHNGEAAMSSTERPARLDASGDRNVSSKSAV